MPDPNFLEKLRQRLGRPRVTSDVTRVSQSRVPMSGKASPEDFMSASDRDIARAVNFIAGHEGFREQAYRDTRGRGQPWTVGYGRTGADVGPTTRMTEEEGRRWLEQRVRQDAERMRQAGVTPHPSLLSFAYNAGYGRLRSSGALDAAKRNDWQAVADALMQVTKGRDAQGRPVELPGLVRRRQEEVAMLQNLLRGTSDN